MCNLSQIFAQLTQPGGASPGGTRTERDTVECSPSLGRYTLTI